MQAHITPITTRRDEVARRLRREIISGALQPGAVIKDAELATRLGTSITPVREALAQLAAEGLVDMPPNRAKRVAALSRQSAVELCEAMLLLAVAQFERGVQRLTRTDLLTMRDSLAEAVAAWEQHDETALFRASRGFSDIVIRTAGNGEIRRMLAMIVARFERLLTICRREGLIDISPDANATILAALEASDQAAAVARFREQMQAFQRSVERLPARIWND